MQFTRIYNDDQGKSHFGEVNIDVHDGGSIGMLSERFDAGQMIFRETTADYDFKWHPAPQRHCRRTGRRPVPMQTLPQP